MKSHHTSPIRLWFGLVAGFCWVLPVSIVRASEQTASDGAAGDYFGQSASSSGVNGLVGAHGNDSIKGSAYLFRDLDGAIGTVTQNAMLTASDGAASDAFGWSVSLSGHLGLIGAYGDDSNIGSAYIFRDLDTAVGTVTQHAKLVASDGAASDGFGYSVSLSGDHGLIGAYGDDDGASGAGSAYLFRDLDTATGAMTQHVKLTASDGAANDFFGRSVSQSAGIGLVGAYLDDVGANANQGSAYVFRDLDTATGGVTENVKLTASDGVASDVFGWSVSLSGNIGLVGAYGDDDNGSASGSAYVFRNLDTATGAVTQDVKLTASDGSASDNFGHAVSQSGSIGLVGAFQDGIGVNAGQGSAYLFLDLDTASGTVTQNVKINASDGEVGDHFGSSVSLDGDRFVIGARQGDGVVTDSGKAYSGRVSSLTTLDAGNVSTTISGISFNSEGDWVIGKTSDHNHVMLGAGDSADVTASGMTVAIGQAEGADFNKLTLAGGLTANEVLIGNSGSFGNTLELVGTASITVGTIKLAMENFLRIEGDYTDINNLLAYLGATGLQAMDGETWETVTTENHASWIESSYDAGYTTLAAIPEPAAGVLGVLGVLCLLRRQRA